MTESLQAALVTLLDGARTIAPEQVAEFMGALEQVRVTALARLTTPPAAPEKDRLLDVRETAKRLGVSESYLEKHHADFPFTVRMGRRVLFSESALERYLLRKAR